MKTKMNECEPQLAQQQLAKSSTVALAGASPEATTRARPRTVMQITWSLVAGGAEIYALTIASNLAPESYRSFLCALDEGGALEDEIKRRGLPYVVMHRAQVLDWRLMWRLYRLFAKTRPDIIQTHHFNQLFYSFIGAKLVGAKLFHTEHSLECYEGRRGLRIALRLMSIFCRKVIAIGGESAQFLRTRVGIPARKLTVVRAGIDTRAFNESKSEARRTLGLKTDERVVSIVARLYPEKNHRLLLAAFSEVVKRIEGARLLIVGEGIEGDNLREEIRRLKLEDNVSMLGVRRDIANILAATDVFALCSDREGLPVAVLEAMAAGVPVVATAVGDLPSVVDDRQTGLIVPPQDPAALAQALCELLENPARAFEMGKAARAAVQGYSLDAMMSRYGELFNG